MLTTALLEVPLILFRVYWVPEYACDFSTTVSPEESQDRALLARAIYSDIPIFVHWSLHYKGSEKRYRHICRYGTHFRHVTLFAERFLLGFCGIHESNYVLFGTFGRLFASQMSDRIHTNHPLSTSVPARVGQTYPCVFVYTLRRELSLERCRRMTTRLALCPCFIVARNVCFCSTRPYRYLRALMNTNRTLTSCSCPSHIVLQTISALIVDRSIVVR